MEISTYPFRDPLPDEIERLAEAAEQEGYPHIRRLVVEWAAGTNRFDRPGEKLLGAYQDGSLVAVGGITTELSCDEWLRMRRFYVLPGFRDRGVARMLAAKLLEHARKHTNTVTVHAGDERAVLFWQAMGFRLLAGERYTHILEFS